MSGAMSPVFGFASYGLRHPRDLFSSVGPTLNELTFGALGSSFDPQRDIGDLTGKVIFVTGGKFLLPGVLPTHLLTRYSSDR